MVVKVLSASLRIRIALLTADFYPLFDRAPSYPIPPLHLDVKPVSYVKYQVLYSVAGRSWVISLSRRFQQRLATPARAPLGHDFRYRPSFFNPPDRPNTMPKTLAKVQKKIAKKRGKSASSLHENSRDAKRLRRAGARSEKLDKLAAARGRASQPLRSWNTEIACKNGAVG